MIHVMRNTSRDLRHVIYAIIVCVPYSGPRVSSPPNLSVSDFFTSTIDLFLTSLTYFYVIDLFDVIDLFLPHCPIFDVIDLFMTSLTYICVYISGYLPVNRTVCLIWFSMDVFFTASTVIHLCTISTDRYFALKDPIKYHQNKQTCHMTIKISIVWILAFCCAGPLFILTLMFERTPYSSYKGCGPVNATFVVSATVISFYLPLLIMLVTYILTVYTLKKQTQIAFTSPVRQMKELSDASDNELTLVSSVDSPVHHYRSRSAKAAPNSHERETQTILPNGRSASYRDTYESTRQNSVPIAAFYDMRKNCYQSDVTNNSKYDSNTLSPHHSIHRTDSYRSVSSHRSSQSDTDYSPQRTWSARASQISRNSKVRLIIRRTLSDTPDAGSSRHSSVRRTAAESVHKGRKAVHILGVLFAAFVIFYLPFFLAYLISGVCVSCRDVITLEMITALEWVEYAGSMVNPIIYRIFNPEFRRAFHILMRCHYKRSHSANQLPTSGHVV